MTGMKKRGRPSDHRPRFVASCALFLIRRCANADEAIAVSAEVLAKRYPLQFPKGFDWVKVETIKRTIRRMRDGSQAEIDFAPDLYVALVAARNDRVEPAADGANTLMASYRLFVKESRAARQRAIQESVYARPRTKPR